MTICARDMWLKWLVQPPNQRVRDKTPLRKFSTMIKCMVIELDRDPTLYPDGNIVEVGFVLHSALDLLFLTL